jgi:tetratricopeptide (TPR) repeat protein
MELGRPDRARAGFEACLCMARLGRSAALERRARAWLGRAMARGGSYAEALACFALAPKDAEAAFFRAEALVAMERYADAGTALSETEAIGYEKGPLYAEAPGFSSGFELVEDCLAGSDALALRSGALRADLERRQGALAQAAERLYGITRGRPGTELDPAYHEFLFMFFLTLPETGSPSPRSEFMSDRGTILSKAFKQLQLRASRIDSADDKNDYIARNPLNRSLTEIARTFKFI